MFTKGDIVEWHGEQFKVAAVSSQAVLIDNTNQPPDDDGTYRCFRLPATDATHELKKVSAA